MRTTGSIRETRSTDPEPPLCRPLAPAKLEAEAVVRAFEELEAFLEELQEAIERDPKTQKEKMEELKSLADELKSMNPDRQ